MKLPRFVYLCFLGIVLALGSCTTQENVNPQETPSLKADIFEQDGRLVFRDVEVYEETRLMLRDNSDFHDVWEQQFPNFTSMRTAFDNLSELEWDRIYDNASNQGFENLLTLVWEEGKTFHVERVVPLDYVATMVNHDGLVQIGNELYKHTQDHLLIIDVSNKEIDKKWIHIHSAEQVEPNAEVKILSFSYQDLPSGEGTRLTERVSLKGNTTCTKNFNSGVRRIRGTIRMGFQFSGGTPYEVVWANTYYEKRKNRFSGWRYQTINRICFNSLRGTARLRIRGTNNFITRNITPLNRCLNERYGISGVIFETDPGGQLEITDWGSPHNLSVEHKIHFTNSSGAIVRTEFCNTVADGMNR
ncbi:MAG: hypothetical protein AAGA10_08905 [Bacteroidota bacterium]